MIKTFKIQASWQVEGILEVSAETFEQAVAEVENGQHDPPSECDPIGNDFSVDLEASKELNFDFLSGDELAEKIADELRGMDTVSLLEFAKKIFPDLLIIDSSNDEFMVEKE